MFKKKVIILSSIAGALALIYALTFVFDREKTADRTAAYRWLTEQQAAAAGRLEINEAGAELPVVLEKQDGTWFVIYEETGESKRYPARAERVESLFAALTAKGAYSIRGSTPEIQQKLGVRDDQTTRITVYTGPDRTLSLIIGEKDASESSIHLRKAGEPEVRGGEDRFSKFMTGGRPAWGDQKLFSSVTGGTLNIDSIQRIIVQPAPEENSSEPPEPYTLARDGTNWKAEVRPSSVTGEPDSAQIAAFLKNIADANAEDYAPGLSPDDEGFSGLSVAARVVLELGDGTTRIITLGPDVDARKTIAVSGSPYVWFISQWTVSRIFRTAADLFSAAAQPEPEPAQ